MFERDWVRRVWKGQEEGDEGDKRVEGGIVGAIKCVWVVSGSSGSVVT